MAVCWFELVRDIDAASSVVMLSNSYLNIEFFIFLPTDNQGSHIDLEFYIFGCLISSEQNESTFHL